MRLAERDARARITALEMRIEQAWLHLCSFARPTTNATLYLTRTGAIYGFSQDRSNRDIPFGARVIGTYNKAVLLQDFRDDVFHVYREMWGHG